MKPWARKIHERDREKLIAELTRLEAAVECLNQQLNDHGTTIQDLRHEIARLESVNAELVGALSVFADPSNWGYDRDLPRAWDNRDIRRPADFARAALARALPQPAEAE